MMKLVALLKPLLLRGANARLIRPARVGARGLGVAAVRRTAAPHMPRRPGWA